jgi:hypothetical protein
MDPLATVRHRISSALVGRTAAGLQVWTDRVVPARRHELPCIAVYVDDESAEQFNQEPREYKHSANVLIEAAVQLDPLAARAGGSAAAAGTNGSPIAAGLVLRRADGWPFVVAAAAVIAAGVAVLELESALDGLEGNVLAGTVLTFAAPPAGVDATVTVSAPGLVGGQDGVDDRMDAIRAEVRAVMTANRYLGDRVAGTNAAYDTRYTGTEFLLSNDGPVPMGVARLSYEVDYLTMEAVAVDSPELAPLTQVGTALHTHLDDKPVTHDHDDDDVHTERELEGAP